MGATFFFLQSSFIYIYIYIWTDEGNLRHGLKIYSTDSYLILKIQKALEIILTSPLIVRL